MKKNLLFTLIGLIAGTTLTAGAAYVYTARDIGYTPSDENWSVTNADQALSSLKSDVNDLNQYRSDIVESLVDKGVDVNENSSIADIKNGIDNMSSNDFLIYDNHNHGAMTGYMSYTSSSNQLILHDFVTACSYVKVTPIVIMNNCNFKHIQLNLTSSNSDNYKYFQGYGIKINNGEEVVYTDRNIDLDNLDINSLEIRIISGAGNVGFTINGTIS